LELTNNPLFSVIIPVYNASSYLDVAVQSIICQTIGFEEYIELILINDGSLDNSEEICLKYKQQYEDNIVYISQKNSGVSATRNRGLELARGKYIAFLDSDDYFSLNAFSMVNKYFSITLGFIDVAVIPVQNCNANTRMHYANDKFTTGTITVDLNNPKWSHVCTRVGQAFFLKDALADIQFDSSVSYFEDTLFINSILRKKMLLGVVTNCKYYYRVYDKDTNSVSLTNNAEKDSRFYIQTPKNVSLALLEKGDNALYFQFIALAEMRWRKFYCSFSPKTVLSDIQYQEYCDLNEKIMSAVTDEAICNFFLYNYWQKLFLLGEKYQKSMESELEFDSSSGNDLITFRGYPLCSPNRFSINLTDIRKEERQIIITGYIYAVLVQGLSVKVLCNDEEIPVTITSNAVNPYTNAHETTSFEYKCPKFSVTIPHTSKQKNIVFNLNINGEHYNELNIKYGNEVIIEQPGSDIRKMTKIHKNIILMNNEKMTVYPLNLINIFKLGIKFTRWSLKKENMKKILRKIKNTVIRKNGDKN
jgi:glycosyltransferase involved in cell wall biosynthesis